MSERKYVRADSLQIQQLLCERIQKMNALADSLTLADAAITACDIDGLEEQMQGQKRLCTTIRALDMKLESLQMQRQQANQIEQALSILTDPTVDETLHLPTIHMLEAHRRVKSLNSVHADLLRRSGRTICALSKAYQSISVEIYSNPVSVNSHVAERI